MSWHSEDFYEFQSKWKDTIVSVKYIVALSCTLEFEMLVNHISLDISTQFQLEILPTALLFT